MYFRLILCLVVSGLVAACATKSPYEPGKSAADIPAQIDVIKLDRLAAVDGWSSQEDVEKRIEANPSQNDQEVAAIAKRAAIAQFENFGMHIIEDDSRPPDIRIKIYVAYQPEAGLVHRSALVAIQVLDGDGNRILKEWDMQYISGSILMGLIIAALQSRDDMVIAAARGAVQKTVKELQNGTKQVSRPLSPTPAASSPAPAVPSTANPAAAPTS